MPQPDYHPTVLVIGPEPGLVAECLLARSCQVVHADSGADAIALAQRHAPGLIIMDLDLENLDPYEVAIDLETMPETREVQLIALVSDPSDDEAIRGRCSGRLLKPVTETTLSTVLDPCLRRLTPPDVLDDGGDGAPVVTGSALSGPLLARIERLEIELARTQEALAGLYEHQVSLRRVANLTEELAQPMTLLMGYAEMLPTDLTNLGTARSDCDIIADQVKRMARTLGLLRRMVPGAPPVATGGPGGPTEKPL